MNNNLNSVLRIEAQARERADIKERLERIEKKLDDLLSLMQDAQPKSQRKPRAVND